MKKFQKIIILVALSLTSLSLWAQNPIVANASLNEVMVYKSGAELKHTAKVALPEGTSELIINNVASYIDESSIQVSAPANITIMSVAIAKDYKPKEDKENLDPEYLRKENLVKEAEKSLNKSVIKKSALESTVTMLNQNQKIGGENTGLTVLELSKMTDYYLAKQIDLQDQIADLREVIATQQLTVQQLRQQLGNTNKKGASTGGQLVLQVMTKAAASNTISINYISPNAGWSAAYDLKADKISAPLTLVYKANVIQNTGLDWTKVKLTLSTGNPSVGSTAPVFMPWFLRYGPVYSSRNKTIGYSGSVSASEIQRRPISDIEKAIQGSAPGIQLTNGGGQPGSNSSMRIRGMGSISSDSEPLYVLDGAIYTGNLSDIDPNTLSSVNVLKDANAIALYGSRGSNGVIVLTTKGKGVSNYTNVEERALDATFSIAIPYTIISNDKPHAVVLDEYKIPADYHYFAAPKLDPDAFLLADITNYEQLNLLPGEANVVFENRYVGKTYLNPYSTKDTLSLSMGRDKRIVIKREKVKDNYAIKLIGSNRKQTFTYEISLKNGKAETVDLDLKDQYPVSTDNSMDIELLSSDNAIVDSETGILTWKMKLQPGETKKIRFSYSVKYPKDKVIGNL